MGELLRADKAVLVNQISDEALAAIEAALRRHREGVSARDILRALATPMPPRTMALSI